MDEDIAATMNKTTMYMLPIMTLVIGVTTVPAGLIPLHARVDDCHLHHVRVLPWKAIQNIKVYTTKAMRRRVLHTIFFASAFLLGGGLFALLVWRTGPAAIWESLVTFGAIPFFGFVAISLLNFTLYSLRWQTIVNDMVTPDKRVSLRTIFLHRMAGYAAGT